MFRTLSSVNIERQSPGAELFAGVLLAIEVDFSSDEQSIDFVNQMTDEIFQTNRNPWVQSIRDTIESVYGRYSIGGHTKVILLKMNFHEVDSTRHAFEVATEQAMVEALNAVEGYVISSDSLN